MLPFSQVDVFTAQAYQGNPVAVVHEADQVSTEQMQRFAHWTNLSETVFLLAPHDGAADYRVRIFTPSEELPFAGHPTIGAAHAWLESGGRPKHPDRVVQDCGVGLVPLRRTPRLAFVAPPLLRFGPPSADERTRILAALRLSDSDVLDISWLVNGPQWVGVRLPSAEAVLSVEPDWSTLGDLEIGLVGPYDDPGPGEPAVEVRAFCPGLGVVEDPVTGSLNAGLGQWLIDDGTLPEAYVASQGTRLGRSGRVYVEREDAVVWVGGDAVTCVRGEALI